MLHGAEERRCYELGALVVESLLCGGCPDVVVIRRGWGFLGEVAGWVAEWGSPFTDDAAPAVGEGDDVAA